MCPGFTGTRIFSPMKTRKMSPLVPLDSDDSGGSLGRLKGPGMFRGRIGNIEISIQSVLGLLVRVNVYSFASRSVQTIVPRPDKSTQEPPRPNPGVVARTRGRDLRLSSPGPLTGWCPSCVRDGNGAGGEGEGQAWGMGLLGTPKRGLGVENLGGRTTRVSLQRLPLPGYRGGGVGTT